MTLYYSNHCCPLLREIKKRPHLEHNVTRMFVTQQLIRTTIMFCTTTNVTLTLSTVLLMTH